MAADTPAKTPAITHQDSAVTVNRAMADRENGMAELWVRYFTSAWANHAVTCRLIEGRR